MMQQIQMICLDHEMSFAANRDNFDLLANATKRTMAKLQGSSEDGLFLMVEGAKIDYAGHTNCLLGSIVETLSFDSAVAEALKFADSNGESHRLLVHK